MLNFRHGLQVMLFLLPPQHNYDVMETLSYLFLADADKNDLTDWKEPQIARNFGPMTHLIDTPPIS